PVDIYLFFTNLFTSYFLDDDVANIISVDHQWTKHHRTASMLLFRRLNIVDVIFCRLNIDDFDYFSLT
uniref:Uncharacterized protein n=1 Tax=Romanomermis culicivorax TaxID=13658 RepID=A0A915J325_ROMCU